MKVGLDPSGLVLAVYHGRQMKRSQLGDGCPDPPTPPTEPTRRVFIYPVEYRSYGPDGVNVVYERENYGVNAGQWVKRYLTTYYQGTVLQAHDVNGDHEQHYELFGAEKGQVARRTGWLDREIDWESSPLTDLYRTVDLVNRKYDPQRGVFLTSDPLWMMSADASSYHYAYHDPMNMIDPWGLDGQKGVGGPPKGDGPGPGVGPSNPSTKEITPFDHSFSFWMDGARGDYLHGIGEGALPGMSIGGGGLGPVGGGNGGTGKTDVASSSSPTGTGNVIASTESKLSTLQVQPRLDGEHTNIAGVPAFSRPAPFHPMLYWKGMPTLINRTNHIIWFKPEKDLEIGGMVYKGNEAYELAPGKSTYVPIDGLKINRDDTHVYKVPDIITTTIVEADGSVQPHIAGSSILGDIAHRLLALDDRMGFLNHTHFVGGNWDALFEVGK